MITTDIQIALDSLQKDNIIAIPTETVYGLAGNAYKDETIRKIFELKQRPLFNPLIVHIKSISFLEQIAIDIPSIAYTLAEKFWPGPLTLILKKQQSIPNIVTANRDTVAVRVPNHPVTLALLEKLDFPLAAPSANPYGSISPTNAKHVSDFFGDKLDVILDGGNCFCGIESTIIGFENNLPILYRYGSLSIEDIEKTIGKVSISTSNNQNPIAPGMHTRHYAPNTKIIATKDILDELSKYKNKRIGVLVFQHTVEDKNILHQEILSSTGNLMEAAKNLYAAMHTLDNKSLDIIIAEYLPHIDIGISINDKLHRASAKE